MTALPPPGTRWGDLPKEQRAALPVGTVLGPSQHDGSTRLVLTEKVTVRRVWMDDDGHPVTFPLSSRVIVSYPPDRDGTSPTDARSLALEEAARECERLVIRLRAVEADAERARVKAELWDYYQALVEANVALQRILAVERRRAGREHDG